MSSPIQVRWPVGGVSEDFGFSDQPGLTAQDAKNVRGVDCVTGRLRGGVRAGTSLYTREAILSGNKVAHINSIATANTNQTIAALGDSLVETWSKTNTVSGPSLGVQCGTQGDAYSLDGACGVMKRNRDGELMWKLTLAAVDKDHVCRAFLVDAGTPKDAGTDLVLAGVSYGGNSVTAKAWAYIQLNDNKVQKLWEISPGGFIEAFTISKDKLFLAVNKADENRSYVIVYDNFLTNTPTEIRRWLIPYPCNDMHASPFDGFIFTQHEASADRDTSPVAPKSTWPSEDWTELDLASYRMRIRANLDASLIETLSIEPRNMSFPNQTATELTAPPPDINDGGNVLMWLDATKQGRNFYQTADKIPTVNSAGTGYTQLHQAVRGAIYRANGGPGGKPCLHFDGKTCGMESEAPASKDKAASKGNLCVLPSHKGAQFAVFMVVRANADAVRRALLCHGGNPGSDSNVSRFITINESPGFSFSSTIGAGEVPGQVTVWEASGVASDGGSVTTPCSAPTGSNGFPLGGPLPDSGFAVITWVCDGGVHDNASNATRSLLRVNGHPCDRWQSAAFSTLMPTQLGYMPRATAGTAAFSGDVCQILVVEDWYDANDVQQSLLGTDTAMSYPDAAWGAASDSMLERLEGFLAHKWGIAHELPGGRAAYLTMTTNAVAAPVQTVTVDGTVYTFVTTPGATANEVKIGSNIAESMTNLYRAINRIGEPGVDYGRATVANTTFRASAPFAVNSTIHYAIRVRTRNPNYNPGAVLAESITGSWNSTTPAASIAGSGVNTGWYPHPFYLERTATTVGGPPRTAGAATISKYWLLRSPYPILAAWDPASGRAKDVLTSNYNDATPTGGSGGSGVGGIGYGVRIASTGAVFSAGARQAAVASGGTWAPQGFSADGYDIRKIPWVSQAFAFGSATEDWWRASLTATTNTHPRMAVDKFDNVYFPAADATTYAVYGIKLASIGTNDPDTLFSYILPTDTNEGYAVAVDPTYPDFTGFPTLKRAEHIILGTSAGATGKKSLFKLRTLSVSQATGAPRTITNIAISGSVIAKFDASTGLITAASGPWVDTDRNAVFSAAFMDKIYIVDGRQVIRYNPIGTENETANTTEVFLGTSSGGVPQRCSLIEVWNGSLVLARQAENPNQYFISKQGDAGNWDISPYTLTAAQAIMGSDGSAGVPPDIINAFIPYNDDFAFIGGDHSIYRIAGRPSPGGGGDIHLVSDSIGIAFGRAWCKDPKGILYFFGSRGGVYRIVPGGTPKPLSSSIDGRSKIERRLQDIDLTNFTVQMAWNDRDKGFHLIVCPYVNTVDENVEHYFWEEAKGAWWPDTWANTALSPTCVAVVDGDNPDDRSVVFGCGDSFIRKSDGTCNFDEGSDGTDYAIDAQVLIGPIQPKEIGIEVLFSRLIAVMANDQEARPYCNVYVTDRADFLGDPVWSGQLMPGRNPAKNFKRRGAFVFIELTSTDPIARWAYEQISLDYAVPAGIKRSLGV